MKRRYRCGCGAKLTPTDPSDERYCCQECGAVFKRIAPLVCTNAGTAAPNRNGVGFQAAVIAAED